MLMPIRSKFLVWIFISLAFGVWGAKFCFAESNFNPNFIISDQELNAPAVTWTLIDIQQFLESKGSYLKNFSAPDVNGVVKPASQIIYEAAQNYSLNPKFLLVTLQKEQSLVTDDSPTQRQLDWATGFAVCDGCYLTDPKLVKYKGFGKQVDGAAGIIRWYYDNQSNPIVKKKDSPVRIDGQDVTPGSWATAFLYTYTPHLHGNQNFWHIWNTWFTSAYPNGTLLQSKESGEYWLLSNGERHRFKNKTALITRADPKTAVQISDIDLKNYSEGSPIAFPNYSILSASSTIYLLDYDKLRPFASTSVVRQLGYNPEEIIEVDPEDLAGYATGTVITASTTQPVGVIYQITDLNNRYYLLKDSTLYPITDRSVVDINYDRLAVEKHTLKELAKYPLADLPVSYKDGTLLKTKDGGIIYVIENSKRRRLADSETFISLGYKYSNVVVVPDNTLVSIPEGEPIYVNAALTSSAFKFLGDNSAPVDDLYSTKLPSYLVAEFPSGRILAGKNIDNRRIIASLTKLLTTYESVNNGFNLKSTLTIPTNFVSDTLKLKKGDVIKGQDLLAAALIASSNTSAELFSVATNKTTANVLEDIRIRLESWGTEGTIINDLSGLNVDNKSTARDLLKIATKVWLDPTILKYSGLPTYQFTPTKGPDKGKLIKYSNTNQILKTTHKDYTILASKTGYLDESGHNVMMLISIPKTKKRYLLITLGNSDYAHRFEEPAKLASWVAQQKFSTK